MKKETEEKIEKYANYFFDYLEDYVGMFLAVFFIASGILELQETHYPEENYHHYGWYFITFGFIMGMWTQWSFKRKVKKNKLEE